MVLMSVVARRGAMTGGAMSIPADLNVSKTSPITDVRRKVISKGRKNELDTALNVSASLLSSGSSKST